MGKSKGNNLLVKTDSFGNALIRKKNNLYLALAAGKQRKIGTFLSDRHLLVFRDFHDHLFRKNKSYGFNSDVLNSNVFGISHISIEEVVMTKSTMYGPYKTETLLDNGDYLMFKMQGFERQIFVPRKYLTTGKFPVTRGDDGKQLALL